MALSKIVKTICPTCGQVAVEVSRTEFGTYKFISLKCGHVITDDILAETDYTKVKSSDGKSLMPFQIEGIKFLEKANGKALIADEMGLGKTVQALGFLSLHKEELYPVLVVTKTTIKPQWMHESVRWLGTKKVQIIDSSKGIAIPGFDVYIITYDLLKKPEMFSMVKLKTMVVDECQAIKDHLSGRAKAVQEIKRLHNIEHIICLSGTPIKNHAGEYFTVLNLLQPTRFRYHDRFIKDYCDHYETMYGYKVGGVADRDYFREQTEDFIIRRTQQEVLPELHALKQPRKFQHVELGKKYNAAYEAALKEFYEAMETDMGMAAKIVIMTKMRRIAGISKVVECVDYIADFITSTDRKIAVFAHHHVVVDLLEQEYNKWAKDNDCDPAVMYRAGDSKEQRLAQLNNPKAKLIIASGLASGEGMDGLQNLCSDMIMLERQWNPANEEQVEGRIARFGQTEKCNFIYMIVTETIDEFFTELVEQKRAYVASTLDNKEIDWNESSLMEELANIIMAKGSKRWSL